MNSALALEIEPTFVRRVPRAPRCIPVHIMGRVTRQISQVTVLCDMFHPTHGESMREFSRADSEELSLLELLRAGRQWSLAEYILQLAIDASYELEDSIGDELREYFHRIRTQNPQKLESVAGAAQIELAEVFVEYREGLAGQLLLLRRRVRSLEGAILHLWRIQAELLDQHPRAPLEADARYELRIEAAVERYLEELENSDRDVRDLPRKASVEPLRARPR